MWPDSLRPSQACWFIALCLVLLFSGGRAEPQVFQQRSANLDPVTARAMSELERMIISGADAQEIDDQLQKIINGSGYIDELAPILYRIGGMVNEAERAARYYYTCIERWTESAWARKALIDLIPLMEMSEGDVGRQYELLIWEKRQTLLQPAEDAARIGENPETLQTETLMHLVRMAHLYDEASFVMGLAQHPAAQSAPETVELAIAAAELQRNNLESAQAILREWLNRNAASDKAAYAAFLLFEAAPHAQARNQALQLIADRYADSLEAKQVQRRQP